jgi:hypothetical protein
MKTAGDITFGASASLTWILCSGSQSLKPYTKNAEIAESVRIVKRSMALSKEFPASH